MLKNLVEGKFFSESLLEEKFVLVPFKGPENQKIHFTDSSNCETLLKSSDDVRNFYTTLFYDKKQVFVWSKDFKLVNLKDLVNENEYCHTCVLKAPLNFMSSDFTLNHLVEDLKVYAKEVKLLKNNESCYAYERFNAFKSFRFIQSLALNHDCFQNLVDEFFTLMQFKHLSTKEHFEALRVAAVNAAGTDFLKTLDAADTFLESFKVKCFENFKKDLSKNTDFVIFSAKVSPFGYYRRNFTFEDELEILINLYPNFERTDFAVLPYPEFLALKLQYFLAPSANDFSKIVIVPNYPSKEVLDTMEKLFDESNDVMNNYEDLYRIATTI